MLPKIYDTTLAINDTKLKCQDRFDLNTPIFLFADKALGKL